MGRELFDRYPDLVERASEMLGWDVRAQCESGAEPGITLTRYLQPALYLVECLTARAAVEDGRTPDVVAGHSLGEYAALQVAGAFDLFDGLGLVQVRGELMGAAQGGGMAAVLGADEARVRRLIHDLGHDAIDLANINSHEQVVVAGPADEVTAFAKKLRDHGVRAVPLAVSAAFHSRYMEDAGTQFTRTLAATAVRDPLIPVVANTTGKLYDAGSVRRVLADQIRRPVRWWQCQTEMRRLGVSDVVEMGPGQTLARLWESTREHPAPDPAPAPGAGAEHVSSSAPSEAPASETSAAGSSAAAGAVHAHRSAPLTQPVTVGSPEFCADWGLDQACVAGSMYRGISSVDLVARMGENGMMGFFGAGGLPQADIAAAAEALSARLGRGGRFGLNLIASTPEAESAVVDLALDHGVRFLEASSFTRLSPDVVRFRFRGARREHDRVRVYHHVIVKLSRPQLAEKYMRPAPRDLLDELVGRGLLSASEAEIAGSYPVAGDICVEADSGGHTDGGNPLVLLPVIQRLRDSVAPQTRVGLSGGLGDPDAVATAFLMGADFVVTGSVNQATVEAGTSETTKDLLAGVDINDTTKAPAGDLFELGAQVQVVRKRTLFPARANKLLQLARAYECLDRLPPDVARDLQERVFKKDFDAIWEDVTARDRSLGRAETLDSRARMMKTFRWYFSWTTMLALEGDPAELVNYQVHCGPAMGALNRFVAGTPLEDWRKRHVDAVNRLLMDEARKRVQAARVR